MNEKLFQLFSEIERAWFDDSDRTCVLRLSKRYPQYEDELHEFFEDLVLGLSSSPPAEFVESDNEVHDWVLNVGLEIAERAKAKCTELASAGSTDDSSLEETRPIPSDKPTFEEPSAPGEKVNFIRFLRETAGSPIKEMACSIQATPEFLIQISRYPEKVPAAVIDDLLGQVESRWGVSALELSRILKSSTMPKKAASRGRAYSPPPKNFGEILQTSQLSPQQLKYWTGIIERAE